MDALLNSQKKQGIMIFLPLLAVWVIGLYFFREGGDSMAADAVMTSWYLFLALLFLELHFVGTGRPAAVWFAVLSVCWGIRAGMTGSRPLPALFTILNRIESVRIEYMLCILTMIVPLPLCLSLKKEHPDCPWQAVLIGIALAVPACIWKPVRFTFSLCFLAAALYVMSWEIRKTGEEKLRALDEAELLAELNRLKNQSYTELAHEMKTPLTVISVNAQLAAMSLEDGVMAEETITDIKIISTEAARLTQMVTSIAGLGQLQGNGIGRIRISPDALIETTARTCQTLCARHGNTLTVDAGPDLPPVCVNADRLTQVLINLISNANRHTRNGIINISIKAQADWLKVSVTDNGEGILPELLPHVFERLCRGDNGDIGLGLFICKKIIDEYGGGIGIESEAGKGTKVWFTLPADKDGSEKEPEKGRKPDCTS